MKLHYSTNSVSFPKAYIALAFGAFILAGCTGTATPVAGLDVEAVQGSEENIASLTRVVNGNPTDPEGANSVRRRVITTRHCPSTRNMMKPISAVAMSITPPAVLIQHSMISAPRSAWIRPIPALITIAV